MKKVIISVIIPVYNSECFLQECIDSVLNQSVSDFEILLIDDGSTDCSGELCDYYSKQDSRIRVFHKENGGQSSARNLALSYVRGEYVFFLDSDDKIASEAFSILLKKMSIYKVDILAYSFDFMDEKSNPVGGYKFSYEHNKVYPSDVFLKKNTILGAMCMYFYRADFLRQNHLRMLEGVFREDEDFVIRAIALSKTIVSISDKLYIYRINNTSTTRNRNIEHKIKLIGDTIEIIASLQGFMKECSNENAILGIKRKIESLKVSVYKEILRYYRKMSCDARRQMFKRMLEFNIYPFQVEAHGLKYYLFSVFVRVYFKSWMRLIY